MANPCPGRCNTWFRSTPEKAVAVPGEPVWCPACTGMVRGAVRALPDAYRALAVVSWMTPRAPSDDLQTHVSGSRGRPSPAPGVDARDDIARLACLWEDDLRHHLRSHAAPLPAGGEEALGRAVAYLNTNFDRMISRPECAREFGEEILHAFQRALQIVKNGPSRRKLHIPCPRCDVRALIQHEGVANKSWFTECTRPIGGCGALFTEQEMAWAAEVRLAVRR